MRKILSILALCLAFAALKVSADTATYTLVDGGSVTADVVKYDDYGVMLHVPTGDTYTNVPWGMFSQDALSQFAGDARIKPLVQPFILPPPPANAQASQISIMPVKKIDYPEHPSLIVGMLTSPLGILLLLVLYGANLYAGFEIALMKARAPAQVMGLSAVLPVIGPVIFLIKPMQENVSPEEQAAAAEQVFPAGEQTPEQIQIVEASWKEDSSKPKEKKLEPQIFARGKFTFNKRFVETKFSSFMGDGKSGDAAKYTMELKTLKDTLAVERIMQVAATEVILETRNGQVAVALGDISEIKLNPKTA